MDLDDTLFDSTTLLFRRWCEVLSKIGIPKNLAATAFKRVYGAGTRLDNKILNSRNLFGKLAIRLRVAVWNQLNIDGQLVDVFPGAADCLKELKSAGVRLYASSLAHHARERLERTKLAEYFEEILGGDMGRKNEHIDKFAQSAGVSREEFCNSAFLIGDALQDMRVARENGLYGIGVSTRYSALRLWINGAKIVVPSVADLLAQK